MDITEATLNAWFDGELAPEQGAAVEAHLREHPETAARVRLWHADREALRAQCEAVLLEPVPARLAQAALQPSPFTAPPWWAMRWAAAVALFVLGGVAGAGLFASLGERAGAQREARADWPQRAAVAHA